MSNAPLNWNTNVIQNSGFQVEISILYSKNGCSNDNCKRGLSTGLFHTELFCVSGRHSGLVDTSMLASGIYLYKISTDGFTDTLKMSVIK